MKNGGKVKISYEPEADILTLEVSRDKIDFAEEVGNFVVHFDKKKTPVLLEILEASKFLKLAGMILKKGIKGRELVAVSK